MQTLTHQAIRWARLLVALVLLSWAVPTVYAMRCPATGSILNSAPGQLVVETANSHLVPSDVVWVVYSGRRIGLFVGNNPISNVDPYGLAVEPGSWPAGLVLDPLVQAAKDLWSLFKSPSPPEVSPLLSYQEDGPIGPGWYPHPLTMGDMSEPSTADILMTGLGMLLPRIFASTTKCPPKVHGNSLAAAGPHDVYVIRDAATGRIFHFGETGRGFEVRGAEWVRTLRNEYGLDAVVEPLETVEGKAAARALETRYINTYDKVFGFKPGYVDEAGNFVPIQKTAH